MGQCLLLSMKGVAASSKTYLSNKKATKGAMALEKPLWAWPCVFTIPASRQNNEITLFFKRILKMTETALINDVISMSFQRYRDNGWAGHGLSLMPSNVFNEKKPLTVNLFVGHRPPTYLYFFHLSPQRHQQLTPYRILSQTDKNPATTQRTWMES